MVVVSDSLYISFELSINYGIISKVSRASGLF